MARPTKFDQDRASRIVNALRAGNTRRTSAKFGGVEYNTFLDWMKKGQAAKELGEPNEFSEFSDAVLLGEAEVEVAMVATLRQAATGYKTKRTRTVTSGEKGEQTITVDEVEVKDWRAGLEWLKRRNRAEYGDTLDVRKLDDETLIRLLERDAQERGDGDVISQLTDELIGDSD